MCDRGKVAHGAGNRVKIIQHFDQHVVDWSTTINGHKGTKVLPRKLRGVAQIVLSTIVEDTHTHANSTQLIDDNDDYYYYVLKICRPL